MDLKDVYAARFFVVSVGELLYYRNSCILKANWLSVTEGLISGKMFVNLWTFSTVVLRLSWEMGNFVIFGKICGVLILPWQVYFLSFIHFQIMRIL